MGDNPHILQRVSEYEGELGKAFRNVLGRFGELQRALTNSKLQQQQAAEGAPAPPTGPSADDLYQQLLRDLAMFEYAMSHARAVQSTVVSELGHYEAQELGVSAQIQGVVESLVRLQEELQQAKRWRAEQEEYELLTTEVQTLPSRTAIEADIAALDQKHAELLIAQETLQQQLQAKRERHLGLTRAYDAIRRDWCAADESAAGIAARAAAAAAAEAERRRAEEEALAYEAAQAAKASASVEDAEEGAEDDEKKKKEEAGLSSDSGSGEGGAAGKSADGEEPEEGAVEEEGAVPSTPPHAGGADAVSIGTSSSAMDTGAADATDASDAGDAAGAAAAQGSSAGADSPAHSPSPLHSPTVADPEADAASDAAAPMET